MSGIGMVLYENYIKESIKESNTFNIYSLIIGLKDWRWKIPMRQIFQENTEKFLNTEKYWSKS